MLALLCLVIVLTGHSGRLLAVGEKATWSETGSQIQSLPGDGVQKIRVVAADEPPYMSPALPGDGLSATIVRTALERAGFVVAFAFERWSRAYEGAEIGVYDVVGSIWRTERRSQDFLFSVPYLRHEIKFIKLKSSRDIQFDSLDDLDGLIVGTLKGYAYDKAFLHSRKFIRLPQNHLLQNLLKLSQGEIDLTLGEVRKISYELKEFMKGSVGGMEVLAKPLASHGTHIAVSRSHPRHQEIIGAFNQALSTMQKDGTYDRILTEFGDSVARSVPVGWPAAAVNLSTSLLERESQ
jgi:polar amino acid transport system substrate-binding protein